MARGNDAEAASRELQSTVGGPFESADELIRRNREAHDPVVMRAGMIRQDDEATDALRSKGFASVKAPNGGKVVDGAVHGDSIVYVAETEDGGLYKFVAKKK